MMKTKSEDQLWRVELVHRNGYHAPYQLVEARQTPTVNGRTDAHKRVMKMDLRLLDFPESWSFQLVLLSNEKQKNGKWLIH